MIWSCIQLPPTPTQPTVFSTCLVKSQFIGCCSQVLLLASFFSFANKISINKISYKFFSQLQKGGGGSRFDFKQGSVESINVVSRFCSMCHFLNAALCFGFQNPLFIKFGTEYKTLTIQNTSTKMKPSLNSIQVISLLRPLHFTWLLWPLPSWPWACDWQVT